LDEIAMVVYDSTTKQVAFASRLPGKHVAGTKAALNAPYTLSATMNVSQMAGAQTGVYANYRSEPCWRRTFKPSRGDGCGGALHAPRPDRMTVGQADQK